ncbi:hypothetical protein GGI13_004367 [Coemansia sp. RSA 455]|nr:hypothetical protein GGI13_004367 [Coemansia sp. RSA 455]
MNLPVDRDLPFSPHPQQQPEQQQLTPATTYTTGSGDTSDMPSDIDCDTTMVTVESVHSVSSSNSSVCQDKDASDHCYDALAMIESATHELPSPPTPAQVDNNIGIITPPPPLPPPPPQQQQQQQQSVKVHMLSTYRYRVMAMDVDSESDYIDPIDAISAMLPSPDVVCLPSFRQELVTTSKLEFVHILAAAEDRSQPSPSMQRLLNEFFTPAELSAWLRFQQSKYDRWATMYPSCRSVTLRLLPQTNNCRSSVKTCLTQCSACIRRVAGITCRCVLVRYISELTIEMVDGTRCTRYLLCPVFRSECEKSPAIRTSTTPIALPGRYVTRDDTAWIEFHVMCMTVSAIKSLLRFELSVVRDVRTSDTRHTGNGTILFHDTAAAKALDEAGESAVAVHPLFGCSPIPCIMRNIPSGPYQNCDECLAPIFSTFFSCCLCMRYLCPECFTSWDDSDVTFRYLTIGRGADKGSKGQNISCCQQRNRTEEGKVVTDRSFHKKSQFMRMSYYTQDELELMIRKANRIVRYCDLLDKTQRAGYSSISLCTNELRLDDPNQSEDTSWPGEELDLVDSDAEIIAKLGDVDFGADPTLRPSAPEDFYSSEAVGAGPSHSQTNHLEALWDEKLESLLQSTRRPLSPWQVSPVYVSADKLTLREFSRLWEEGWVVVVTGLITEQAQEMWTPEYLQRILGELCVSVSKAESRLASMGNWSLSQFLQLFGGRESSYSSTNDDNEWADCEAKLRSMRLCALAKPKLNADQKEQSQSELAVTSANAEPPAKRARTRANEMTIQARSAKGKEAAVTATSPSSEEHHLPFEQLLNSAAALIPFKEYVAHDGQLDLVNRLPAQYTRPDFEPELHFMYGTQNDGSRENMRCETADFVHLMLYAGIEELALQPPSSKQKASTAASRKKSSAKAATRGKKAAGVKSRQTRAGKAIEPVRRVTEWDIYPASALDILCEYLGVDEQEASGSSKRNVLYKQSIFMDDNGCSEVFETYGNDAQCYRVYQQPGDAVFLPLGCMFQRRSYANTISVQSRFISPEHIADTRQVAGRLNTTKQLKRKEYSLPVMDILWWAWMGQQEQPEQHWKQTSPRLG